MDLDILIPVLVALATLRFTQVGLNLKMSPQDTATFIGCGIVIVFLTGWQAYRNTESGNEVKNELVGIRRDYKEAQDDLVSALKDMVQLQKSNLQLQHENMEFQKKTAALQNELSEKVESDRRQHMEEQARKEAAHRKREQRFAIPFKELKQKAFGNIRMLNESFYNTNDHMNEALKWWHAVRTLLDEHCSDPMIAAIFRSPHREAGVPGLFSPAYNKRFREEYPNIMMEDWVRFAAFYRLRMEDLDKEDLSKCQ